LAGKYLTPDVGDPKRGASGNGTEPLHSPENLARDLGRGKQKNGAAGSSQKVEGKNRKPPVDKKRALLYLLLAAVIVIFFLPVMVVIHELGHAAAILLLGGEVTGYEVTRVGASVSFTGIEGSRDLFIVHVSGVLANLVVGAYLLFHVWRFKGHPFQEALTLIWGLMLFLTDFISYSIADMFYDHGGDFDKIYDSYPWSESVFLLIDLLLLVIILFVLSRDKFWKGIQLPRKMM